VTVYKLASDWHELMVLWFIMWSVRVMLMDAWLMLLADILVYSIWVPVCVITCMSVITRTCHYLYVSLAVLVITCTCPYLYTVRGTLVCNVSSKSLWDGSVVSVAHSTVKVPRSSEYTEHRQLHTHCHLSQHERYGLVLSHTNTYRSNGYNIIVLCWFLLIY